RRALSRGAGRDRPRAVHHHAHRQLPVALADLVDDAERGGPADARADRDGGGHVSSTTRRKMLSSAFVAFCAGSVIVALVPLGFVLFFVITQGIRALNVDFFLHMPKPVGEPGGGMANAIVGTLMVSGLAALMAVPIGVASGVYVSEYRGTKFASVIRFAADTLNGVPSIVIGVFAYGAAVLP